ncbi:DUF2997 domain-containing protein [Bremerella sp. JC770]|uniref:DUF2997 domain-containing protein n=1 Tax=Bremerella sp. JC770 TaxID=3232137 RepID=UPI0034594B17
MNRIIEITVTKDGQTRVETKGFVGSDCQAASRFLENALGQRQGETLKPAFYQPETLHQQTKTGT